MEPQEPPAVVLPTPGGEVILPTARDVQTHDRFGYAAARRMGDVLYVSGVVAGPLGAEGRDAAAFEKQVLRAFEQLDGILKAAGAGWADVAMINSFHVFGGPGFRGSKAEQFQVVGKVKGVFMQPPHPAWTAVGVTELFPPDGVVEIQLIVHSPAQPR